MGRVFTLLILLTVAFYQVSAQGMRIRFSPLNIRNAPRLSTKGIYHDREGYMWFGSWHNLGRFDGYKIRYYSRSELSNSQFQNVAAKLIFEDTKGDLWIATDAGGLMRYDRKHDRFDAVNDSTTSLKAQASACVEDDAGNFWISTLGAGLHHYDTRTGKIQSYRNDPGDASSLPSDQVNEIALDRENNLWIATAGGLCRYDRTHNNFTVFPLTNNFRSDLVKYKSLQALHVASNGKLYIGSLNGLHVFDPRSLEDKHFLCSVSDRKSISHNEISDVLEDAEGRIWIATVGGGLNIYTPETGFQRIQADPRDPQSLPSDFISKLYLDRNKIIWVSTFENGIVLHDTNPRLINCVRHNPNDARSLRNGSVFSILPVDDSIVWVGLSRGGLNRLNIYTERSSRFLYDDLDPSHQDNNTIEQVTADTKGNLWVGTFNGGLKKFHPQTGAYKRYIHDAVRNSIGSSGVSAVWADRSDNVWITHSQGADLINAQSGHVVNFRNDSIKSAHGFVLSESDISETSNGIWFVLPGQLAIYDKAKRIFTKPDIPDLIYLRHVVSLRDSIVAFYRDGTMRWLSYTSPNEMYSKTILRLKDNILAMCADPAGNVWALTARKLLKINPQDGTYKEIYYADELPDGPIFPDVIADGHGRIFFSLIDEICWFYVDRIENQTPPKKVVFSDFKVFNKTAYISESAHPSDTFTLPNHISQLEVLELSHRESFFSFEFTAMEYLEPQKLQYAYKMEGFDRGWVNIGNRNFVSYTSLNPGEYRFMVRVARQEGIWSDQIASIKVIIRPPFWKTWWFIALELFVVAALVYAFLQYRISHSIKLERIRNKIASDLHDEVGSSLTRISIYADLLQNGLDDKQRHDYTRNIGNLSRDVVNTMSDIIWSVDNKSDNVGDLIIRMKDFATEVLRSKGIEIAFEVNEINEKKSMNPVVKQNIYLIFKEAINNIIKHADSSCVQVKISNNNSGFEMVIQDNGKGMDSGANPKGHGLKNMGRRAAAINAELLFSVNEGTLIRLTRKQI